jgi:hypothetical protein
MAEVVIELGICQAVCRLSVVGYEGFLKGAKVDEEVCRGVFLIELEKGGGNKGG